MQKQNAKSQADVWNSVRIFFIYTSVTLHLIELFCYYTKTLLYNPPERAAVETYI